jgi:hypothetical protein
MRLAQGYERGTGHHREARAERKGNQQSARRYQWRGAAAVAQWPEIDLITHGEHENYNSELGDDRDVWYGRVCKKAVRQMSRQAPEQARAKRDAGEYLADHSWLTAAARDGAQQRGNSDDKRDITDDISGQDIQVHAFPALFDSARKGS